MLGLLAWTIRAEYVINKIRQFFLYVRPLETSGLRNYLSETSGYSRPQIITTPFARCVTGLVHNY